MVLPAGFEDIRVCDVWREGSGWNFNYVSQFVTEHTKLMLASVVLDNVTGARDRISWGGSMNGNFTVKSAYSLLTRVTDPKPNMQKIYDRVWRVVAPERVRVFIWLVVNQVIMTNVERKRRHLIDTDLCSVCKQGEESIIHVLRNCQAQRGIWSRTVVARKRRCFFEQTLLEWLYRNLGDDADTDGSPWSTMFALGIWWIWKWRCGNVFGANWKCRDRVQFLKDRTKEVTMAHVMLQNQPRRAGREERRIGWLPPGEGWIKLNTDGASRGNPGLATAGGVLRDGDGTWRGGFALNIDVCSAPLAELWGVYYGLYIAWEKRITRLELEVDSEIMVGFLKTGINDSHPLSFLVRLCYGFLSRDWIVRVFHVYREANRLADGLANYAFSLSLGFHMLESKPDVVDSIVFDDAFGCTRPRYVRV